MGSRAVASSISVELVGRRRAAIRPRRHVPSIDPATVRKRLGANLQRLAERRGFTVDELADYAGVERSELYAVLAGTTSPKIDRLDSLAQALGVYAHELLR